MDQQSGGVFCALWTPVDEEMRVDTRTLRSILEFVLEQKVPGIMALGSTGEFVHLSTAQRKEVLEVISGEAPGRPLIANVSHVRWGEAVELGLHARDQGAEMIALLPPWFYPMSQDEIAEFMVNVAEAVDLPLLIYNFPEMTGKRVEIETIRKVAGRVKVKGVKQSGGDFEYHRELGELAQELEFLLFTGADTSFAEAWAHGARGIVSGLANAVPEVVMKTHNAVCGGEVEGIARERRFLTELSGWMGKLAFPLNIKAAMEARGVGSGAFKTPVSRETSEKYHTLVAELRQLYSSARLF